VGAGEGHPDHHIQFQRALYSVPTVNSRLICATFSLPECAMGWDTVFATVNPDRGGKEGAYSHGTEHDQVPEAAGQFHTRIASLVRCDRHTVARVLTEPTDPPRRRQRGSTLEARRAAVRSWIAEAIPTTRMLELARQVERYGGGRVNAACARALGFDLLDVGRVETILRTALEREPGPAERGHVVPLPARFARAPESFAHSPRQNEPHVPEIAPDLVRRLKRLRLGSTGVTPISWTVHGFRTRRRRDAVVHS
jgi:hypothetical protein